MMSDRNKLAGLPRLSWFWWLGLVVWGTVLFVLSETSGVPSGPGLLHQDKVLHAAYFTGGGFCLVMALYGRARPAPRLRVLLTGLLLGAVGGALDEWHQTFTPGRSGNDPGDWLADCTGGLIGAWLALKALRWSLSNELPDKNADASHPQRQ